MSRYGRLSLGLAVAAGLCAAALEGAPRPKPPATCPTCPIVYAQMTLGPYNSDLVLMQPDGTGKTVVLTGGQYERYASPTFAPDGVWIAFSGFNPVLDGKFQGIWFVRWDGAYPTQALPTCSSGNNLAWRPVAGTPGLYWLVFSDDCGPSGGLWAVEVDLRTSPPSIAGEKVCLSCEAGCPDCDASVEDGWGHAAFSANGTHLAVERSTTTPYSYWTVVYDFVDGTSPQLGMGKVIDVPAHGTSFLAGEWGHTTDRLIGYSLEPALDLWWLDIDHSDSAGPMITNSGCLTCSVEDGFKYIEPDWSQDDSDLVYYANSGETGGLFVSSFESFVRDAYPIAPTSKKVRVYGPSWKPPLPQ